MQVFRGIMSEKIASQVLVVAALLLLVLPAVQTSAQQSVHVAAPGDFKSDFRLQVTPVGSGAELLTIWANVVGTENSKVSEIPLISVLRDTLGDQQKENDLLRQVWVHSYTRPTLLQKAAAFIPFLYRRVGNKPHASLAAIPPPVIDLSKTDREMWSRLFSSALTNFLVTQPLLRLSTHNYQRDLRDYRQANIFRALTILSLYQSQATTSPLTNTEITEIESRLVLSEKMFGGLVDSLHFQDFPARQTVNWRDTRGHNWELLRQQAESSGLYFEALSMPDGGATHAVLWIAKPDLKQPQDHRYEGRFLSIKNPWTDSRLLRWKGFAEEKNFDGENRPTSSETPGSRRVEMIPLAVYGLEFPKIPALLIDFRDGFNPKKRELSRRVFDEVARDVFSISRAGNLYYLLGRTAFDFVTSRRGIDLNQPSRSRSYAQLKLLLSLNADISPELRAQLAHRLQTVSVNPLEGDWQDENELALDQYKALIAYSQRKSGLPAQLEKARREEMTKFVHNNGEQVLFRLANLLTFGRYSHREKMTPESLAQLDQKRQLAYHTRFLRQVMSSTALVEVSSNMADVNRSLRYIAENGASAGSSGVQVVRGIFARTEDYEARALCLRSLQMIGNENAKKELQRIQTDERTAMEWRRLAGEYLSSSQYKTAEPEKEIPSKGAGSP
jgi:hypothetical protein